MRFLCLCLLTALASCTSGGGGEGLHQGVEMPAYLAAQIHWLDSLQPGVDKKVKADDQLAVEHLATTDSAFWTNELTFFKELDVNLPALRDIFQIDEEPVGDLIWRRFRRKESVEAGLDSLDVLLAPGDSLGVWPLGLKAWWSEQYKLYDTHLYLELHTDTLPGVARPVLTRYLIRNEQQRVGETPAFYQVGGTLNYELE